MFGIEKSLGRVMGPMGLLAVGAVTALLTVPGVRKGARRLAVSTIAGALSLTDEVKKVAVDARSGMGKLSSEAKGELDRLVDEARAFGEQPLVALAAVPAGPADTLDAATMHEPAARPEPARKPAKRVHETKEPKDVSTRSAKTDLEQPLSEAKGTRKNSIRARIKSTKAGLDKPRAKRDL